MRYLLIDAGCAECHAGGPISEEYPPLIDAIIVNFNDIDEVKQHVTEINSYITYPSWQDHPTGGVILQHGQGAIWILPLESTGIR